MALSETTDQYCMGLATLQCLMHAQAFERPAIFWQPNKTQPQQQNGPPGAIFPLTSGSGITVKVASGCSTLIAVNTISCLSRLSASITTTNLKLSEASHILTDMLCFLLADNHVLHRRPRSSPCSKGDN